MRVITHHTKNRIDQMLKRSAIEEMKALRIHILTLLSENLTQLEHNAPDGLITVFMEILREVISGLLTTFLVSYKMKSETFEQELKQLDDEIKKIKTSNKAIRTITLLLCRKRSTLYVTSLQGDNFEERLKQWEVKIGEINIAKGATTENILLAYTPQKEIGKLYFIENKEVIRISFGSDKLSISLGSNNEVFIKSPGFIKELSSILNGTEQDKSDLVKLDSTIQICQNVKLQKFLQKQKHLIQKELKRLHKKDPTLYPKSLLKLFNEKSSKEPILSQELKEKICSHFKEAAEDCKQYYLVKKQFDLYSQKIKTALEKRIETEKLLRVYCKEEPKEKIINSLISSVKKKSYLSETKFEETITNFEEEIKNLKANKTETKEEDVSDDNNKTNNSPVDIFIKLEKFFTAELATELRKQFPQNFKQIFILLLQLYVSDQKEKHFTELHTIYTIEEWRLAEKKLNNELITKIKDLLDKFPRKEFEKELTKKESEKFKPHKTPSGKKSKKNEVEMLFASKGQKKPKEEEDEDKEDKEDKNERTRSMTF